jgi:hypothetical protein
MVRHGPASVCTRKSAFQAFLEDCPDRFRPPPCMPDDDDPTWSVSRYGYGAISSPQAPFREYGARRGAPALQWLVSRRAGAGHAGSDLLDLLRNFF